MLCAALVRTCSVHAFVHALIVASTTILPQRRKRSYMLSYMLSQKECVHAFRTCSSHHPRAAKRVRSMTRPSRLPRWLNGTKEQRGAGAEPTVELARLASSQIAPNTVHAATSDSHTRHEPDTTSDQPRRTDRAPDLGWKLLNLQ